MLALLNSVDMYNFLNEEAVLAWWGGLMKPILCSSFMNKISFDFEAFIIKQ
jgi:hypothetical protein